MSNKPYTPDTYEQFWYDTGHADAIHETVLLLQARLAKYRGAEGCATPAGVVEEIIAELLKGYKEYSER